MTNPEFGPIKIPVRRLLSDDSQGRPYPEATRFAVAEMIVSEDQLEHVRLEAGNPDMTLREAAVWMIDRLFPSTPYDPSTPYELPHG